jgi:hypothetical protein
MSRRPHLWLALALLVPAAACGGGGGDDDDGPSIDAAVDGPPLTNFSFFVTSLNIMRELSGSQDGFGGDLRFGETGPGAGLRGADKICTTIAERSMPGSSVKQWRAYLSAADGGNGQPVHAITRIGSGPWYDRQGRLLAPTLADLMGDIRPQNGDPTIKNDFPNEDGVPNHDPDGTGDVDNHDFLTGSDRNGMLYGARYTCLDWTANAGNETLEGEPRVGHSWPRLGFPGDETAEINGWSSSLTESGCAPEVAIVEMGPPDPNSNTVGSGGGYGGIYCFALMP